MDPITQNYDENPTMFIDQLTYHMITVLVAPTIYIIVWFILTAVSIGKTIPILGWALVFCSVWAIVYYAVKYKDCHE